jgi:hypothetical protein
VERASAGAGDVSAVTFSADGDVPAAVREAARDILMHRLGPFGLRKVHMALAETYDGQTYRVLDCGEVRDRLQKLVGKDRIILNGFPRDLLEVAIPFKMLQEERHRADYDPSTRSGSFDADNAIILADIGLSAIAKLKKVDRVALAVWLLLDQPRESRTGRWTGKRHGGNPE